MKTLTWLMMMLVFIVLMPRVFAQAEKEPVGNSAPVSAFQGNWVGTLSIPDFLGFAKGPEQKKIRGKPILVIGKVELSFHLIRDGKVLEHKARVVTDPKVKKRGFDIDSQLLFLVPWDPKEKMKAEGFMNNGKLKPMGSLGDMGTVRLKDNTLEFEREPGAGIFKSVLVFGRDGPKEMIGLREDGNWTFHIGEIQRAKTSPTVVSEKTVETTQSK